MNKSLITVKSVYSDHYFVNREDLFDRLDCISSKLNPRPLRCYNSNGTKIESDLDSGPQGIIAFYNICGLESPLQDPGLNLKLSAVPLQQMNLIGMAESSIEDTKLFARLYSEYLDNAKSALDLFNKSLS